ncbi:MAG: DUF4278 domain-containing protein [Desertifilum sp. SIO1I2]|nr:DUF4278 domain-containing protein [Desertifilum sp. SIO1I2]
MKLSYRGTPYEHEPIALDMAEADRVAKYRGQEYRQRYPRHIPVPQAPLDLKYRGIAYSTYQTPEPEAVDIATHLNRTFVNSPSEPLTRHKRFIEAAQLHRANILKRLEHRIQVARSKGDVNLLQQLEVEKLQLVESQR